MKMHPKEPFVQKQWNSFPREIENIKHLHKRMNTKLPLLFFHIPGEYFFSEADHKEASFTADLREKGRILPPNLRKSSDQMWFPVFFKDMRMHTSKYILLTLVFH